MSDFRINVSSVVSCPRGTVVDPQRRRLVLPDGSVLAPWIALEIDEHRDLSFDELLELGVEEALDIDRDIDPL